MTAERGQAEYDYVVVGSGAGGGPVAANLAKAGYRVLVLEAGKDESDNLISQVPVLHPVASEDPALRWDFFVKHYSEEARQRQDSKFDPEHKGILYPRAGTLGGCTTHNAMITVRPSDSDWDEIAEITGDANWHSDAMGRYFQRLECCRYGPGSAYLRFLRALTLGIFGNPSGHGYKGWLTTENADPTLALPDKKLITIILEAGLAVIEASSGSLLKRLIGAIGRLKGEFDPNDYSRGRKYPEGLAVTPLATNQGQRNGPREYLKRVQKKYPKNLIIQTNALAARVLFDDNQQAIGVEYLEGEKLYRADRDVSQLNPGPGIKRQVYVKREVILSGGAFNTPQLLMLSGVGPKEELVKHGIAVRVDLPGVGRNLQDRYEVTVINKMKGDFGLLKGATFSTSPDDRFFVDWQKYREGAYTSNGVLIGIIKRSKPERPDPDLYIFGVPGFFKGYFPGYHQFHIKDRNFFSWAILKGHTRNTSGRVTLNSSDPRDPPDINFRYFDDDPTVNQAAWEEDLDSVVEGIKFVRRMNRDTDLARIIEEEHIPGKTILTTEQIREHIKNEAWGHHASCTCKIGRDDDKLAVLDCNFRVRGTKNLRVVDASVFPFIPGLFLVSAVYMISEKASDDILADAKRR